MRKRWFVIVLVAVLTFCISLIAVGCKPNETVEPLQLNASEKTISVYETFVLTAEDAEGITFVSSDSDVASVAEDGTVTGLKEGSATITASAGERNGACVVTVTATNDVPALKVSAEKIDLIAGADYTLSVGVLFREKSIATRKFSSVPPMTRLRPFRRKEKSLPSRPAK